MNRNYAKTDSEHEAAIKKWLFEDKEAEIRIHFRKVEKKVNETRVARRSRCKGDGAPLDWISHLLEAKH